MKKAPYQFPDTRLLVVAEAGLEPTTFGLCLPTTTFVASNNIVRICGLDCTFILDLTLGCPITSLYTCSNFLELGSVLPSLRGFTEFKG